MQEPDVISSRVRPGPGHVLPMLLAVGGCAVAILALSPELLGVSAEPGVGVQQWLATGLAGSLLVAAWAADRALGAGHFRAWFTERFGDRRGFMTFAAIATQVALLVVVAHRYQLENRAFFHNILLLSLYGFLLNHFLPPGWRMRFFLVLSIVGIFSVLGAVNTAWLTGVGFLLIAICHIPVSFGIRVALVVTAGAVLIAMRAEWLYTPVPSAVWPILGSMFMFRLMVFLYDLKHQKDRAPLSQTVAYFFLLPNVVFPLFPVVDYKTFRRTYYDAPWPSIYQRGVDWMFRGVTHLLLYRAINHYAMSAPEEIATSGDLLRFLVANFLLYLRVSGQFHMIVGILHLFGFHLPETNHKYCLAAGFTDFWRRINIYWKDFMLKLFYTPAYFALQKLGTTPALVLATLFVFVVTWFLHAYQWFWLRGSFPVSSTDGLFWAVLGVLMAASTLVEAKRGRKRTLGKVRWTATDVAFRSLQTAGTFATVVVLWSLWSSTSVSDWAALFSLDGGVLPPTGALIPNGWIVALAIMSMITAFAVRQSGALGKLAGFVRTPFTTSLLLLTLYLGATPIFASWMNARTRSVMHTLRTPGLTRQEADLLRRGYYENLMAGNNFNSQLWDRMAPRMANRRLEAIGAARRTESFYGLVLVPSARVFFLDQLYTVNRWGMRDREYELTAPGNTFRIAVLGSSHTNGWGVSDEETFESIIEARLNAQEHGLPRRSFELLNFSVPAYTLLQQVLLLEEKVVQFGPHAILLVVHANEIERAARDLSNKVRDGVPLRYEELEELVQQAGVTAGMSEVESHRRLRAIGDRIVAWAYRRIAAIASRRAMHLLLLDLPLLEEDEVRSFSPTAPVAHLDLARDAGFETIELLDVYEGHDPGSLRVAGASWDRHPNSTGHRLLAERLYPRLRSWLDDVIHTVPAAQPVR